MENNCVIFRIPFAISVILEQLICTAHNVMLMDEDWRRDQIYFTSKDYRGKSLLVSLADYTGVRKNDLFSKKYLAGFYASLPRLNTAKE